ncbi:MAG: NAD(+) synthase [Schleiferiaceae bacterium]|jgi:NAD+ synthase|nr:NAD(+) synthase [Schleiferiaceae bacterium]
MKTTEVIDHIVNWLKEYAVNAHMKGFVVGVSGGIDSAVTASLCAKTGLDVLLLEMPIHQAESQVNRAWDHMKNLEDSFSKVSTQNVDLTPIFDSFIGQLPEQKDTDAKHMALVNSRARLRMTTLYYFGQLNGLLVAGTGNKVEDFGVGFYTKYGDGGVDLSPIADLVKTEVYALGKELGVPESILVAPPTDGLWGDDRTDEDQIGASYPELEWAMEQQDAGKSLTDFEGRQKEVFEIYSRLNRINQHKMNPIPVCNIPKDLK